MPAFVALAPRHVVPEPQSLAARQWSPTQPREPGMQTVALTVGWWKRVDGRRGEVVVGAAVVVHRQHLGDAHAVPGAAGSATQNVAGWPARSAQYDVQRALQKPRPL